MANNDVPCRTPKLYRCFAIQSVPGQFCRIRSKIIVKSGGFLVQTICGADDLGTLRVNRYNSSDLGVPVDSLYALS